MATGRYRLGRESCGGEVGGFRGIVLLGANVASYKFALAKSILALAESGGASATLEVLPQLTSGPARPARHFSHDREWCRGRELRDADGGPRPADGDARRSSHGRAADRSTTCRGCPPTAASCSTWSLA